jgi:hypothetical protein
MKFCFGLPGPKLLSREVLRVVRQAEEYLESGLDLARHSCNVSSCLYAVYVRSLAAPLFEQMFRRGAILSFDT